MEVGALLCICALSTHIDVFDVFLTTMDSLVYLNRRSCHSFLYDLVWEEMLLKECFFCPFCGFALWEMYMCIFVSL